MDGSWPRFPRLSPFVLGQGCHVHRDACLAKRAGLEQICRFERCGVLHDRDGGNCAFAGGLVDRYGPRSIMSCGLAFLAAGMFLVASISVESQEWKLLVGFSLLGGIGFGVLAQHVVATAIATRFTTRRGLATGLGVSGSSGGQLVLLPILPCFSAGAWQNSFWLLGQAQSS